MAINTQTIRIDLNTGRTIPVAFAHQNDTNRQLTFQLYNNGVAFTPSSTTVKFAYKSPIVNGRYSVITGSQMASGTVSGNTVTVTLPAQYTQVSGVGLLTMILTTSGNTLRPVNIKFVCQGSADGDDTVLGASDWPEGLYDYMDNWLEENEPTEIANLKSDLSSLADMNSENIEELLPLVATYIETGADGASNYYKRITALSTSKEYIFVINVPTTDTYLIQCGSNSSASAMVDTVYNGKLFAGDNVLTGYVPTGAWIWARNDHNATWSIKVYEKFESIAPIVFENRTEVAKTPKVEPISVATFSASPYNNLIGNLDVNTITSIIPSHNALDYPFGISGYYTVITTGESSSPIQIAVDLYGRMYRRKKSSSGWRDWQKEAVEYTNQTLTNRNVYSDFNDFPIGSIITVAGVKLDNSPEGFANTGHDVMDTGVITATVMTISTTPYSPYLKSQLCIYYRPVNEGLPRIAYRSAQLLNGAYVWSKWSTLSEDGVIHSTNKVVDIDHLDYTFDDFNDAPINTIYQVDFNTGTSVANNPAPGRSGSLMTWGFSNSSRHALSQFYISRDGTTGIPMMFFRYCVEVGTHEYQWSKWCQVQTTTIET